MDEEIVNYLSGEVFKFLADRPIIFRDKKSVNKVMNYICDFMTHSSNNPQTFFPYLKKKSINKEFLGYKNIEKPSLTYIHDELVRVFKLAKANDMETNLKNYEPFLDIAILCYVPKLINEMFKYPDVVDLACNKYCILEQIYYPFYEINKIAFDLIACCVLSNIPLKE